MDTEAPKPAWEWIADHQCYIALCSKRDNIEMYVTKLMACTGAIYESNYKEAEKMLHNSHEKFEDWHKRVLLASIAMRVVAGIEPTFIFDYDDGMTALESILNLITKLEPVFADSDNGNVLHSMWLNTLKKILLQETNNADVTLTRYSGRLSLIEIQSCKDLVGKKHVSKEKQLSEAVYAESMLSDLENLNSLLAKPFICKVDNKIHLDLKEKPPRQSEQPVPEPIVEHVRRLFRNLSSILNSVEQSSVDKRTFEAIPCLSLKENQRLSESPADKLAPKTSILCDAESLTHDRSYDIDEIIVANSKHGTTVTSSHDLSNCIDNSDSNDTEESSFNINKLIVCDTESDENDKSDHEQTSPSRSLDPNDSLLQDSYIICGVLKFSIGAFKQIKMTFPFPEEFTDVHIERRWQRMVRENLVELKDDGTIVRIPDRYKEFIKIAEKCMIQEKQSKSHISNDKKCSDCNEAGSSEKQQKGISVKPKRRSLKRCLSESHSIQQEKLSNVSNTENKSDISEKQPEASPVSNKNVITISPSGFCDRRTWTIKQDAYIIVGIQEFGFGLWAKIRRAFPFPQHRKGTHLKDRWRTMLKKDLVEVNEDRTIKSFNDCYIEEVDKAMVALKEHMMSPTKSRKISNSDDSINCGKQSSPSRLSKPSGSETDNRRSHSSIYTDGDTTSMGKNAKSLSSTNNMTSNGPPAQLNLEDSSYEERMDLDSSSVVETSLTHLTSEEEDACSDAVMSSHGQRRVDSTRPVIQSSSSDEDSSHGDSLIPADENKMESERDVNESLPLGNVVISNHVNHDEKNNDLSQGQSGLDSSILDDSVTET